MFLSNHGVVIREERRFADEHSIQDNIESQVLDAGPEYFERKVFVLYVNNIEILCDDEEFVYDKERLLPSYLPGS
jgi:hypothetical protein